MSDFNLHEFHSQLILLAKKWNGKFYLVGGAVRDEILGMTPKDLDYVATKISLEDLSKELQSAFPTAKVNLVGESFGVVKLTIDNNEFDFAIPRADIDRETVKTDPNIPIEEDLLRRDFTCNSMAKDLTTGDIINPKGCDGLKDIHNKLLRATGDAYTRFKEDPLRILRGISIASRFDFSIERNTLEAMVQLRSTLHSVSLERFHDEFYKGWTKGNTSLFFGILAETYIGREMFGEDFNPYPVPDVFGDRNELFIAQYMAAFYYGGDYKLLSKKVQEQQWIEAIRTIRDLVRNKISLPAASKKLCKHSDKFKLILIIIQYVDRDAWAIFSWMLERAFIPKISKEYRPWELQQSGEVVIRLYKEVCGIDLVGKKVNKAIYDLIEAYQLGKIVNTDEQAVCDYLANKYITYEQQ
jgi:tRNA nucleotidyltransferase/poly(A) polymerase